MKITRRMIRSFALMLVICGSAGAADLSYTYVDLNLVKDNASPAFDGFGLAGSYAFSDSLFLSARYQSVTSDEIDVGFGSGTIDVRGYLIGAGWHAAVSDGSDFVAQLAYLHGDADSHVPGAAFSLSDSGYDAGIGIRSLVTPALELNVGWDYSHSDSGGSSTLSSVGGIYSFDAFGVRIAFLSDSEDTTTELGIRIPF